MWLPKAERKLLRWYYIKIGESGKNRDFLFDELSQIIDPTAPLDHPPIGQEGLKIWERFLKNWKMINVANKNLAARQLIILREYPDHSSAPIKIELTITGYDLGSKYDRWWSRSNLWYSEHIKYHWICVIAGFLCGIISGLLIKWLSTIFIETPGAK